MGNVEREGAAVESETSIEGTLLMLGDKTPHVAVPVQAIYVERKRENEKTGKWEGEEGRGDGETRRRGERWKERDSAVGQLIATTLSDENGKYRFINLKPGQYQLRCQVLNGYVYYRATDHALRFTSYDSGADDPSDTLDVQRERTLKNIDFRFAPFKKGTWRNYNYLDGLVENYVRDIYCCPDGILWFATTGGVSRYDGKEFINFTTKDGLVPDHVQTIHCDPDGVMWFGATDGVSRYDGKKFINFTAEDGLAGNWIRDIYRDPDGVLWFATDGGVSQYDGKEFVNLTTEDGLAHKAVWTIHRDPDAVMWFSMGGWRGGAGVSRYDGKEFVNFTTEDGLAGNGVSAIYCDPDGVMWFATDSGVSRYDGKEFVNLTTDDGLVHNQVNAIYGDPDGVLWFGTEGGGVSRYDGKTFVNFTTKDGLPDNRVNVINRDPDGAIWFGTEGFGICRYDGETFISLTTKDGLVDDRVNAIHCDPDGILWFGTGYWKGGEEGAGISGYDGKEFINFTEEDGVLNNSVLAIHRDPDGVLWFGTGGGGVSRYDGKEFVNFTTEDGLADNQVRAIHHGLDGVLWFGTGFWRGGSGVSRYDGREFVSFTTEDGLAYNAVTAIYCDPDGLMWFGTMGGGVSRYDGVEFVNLTTEDGLVHNEVCAIHRDADNALWFGTRRGVSRYDGKGFVNFTTEDGLASNAISAICHDSGGILWFGTGTGAGVSGYDGTAWTSLDTRDGLAGNDFGSILQDPDGFLWFGTEDGGVTRYRRSTVPPRVYIASVTTDQIYRDLSSIPAFTPGTRVTIEYSSIDLKTLPEKRQYRCRVYETGDVRHQTSDPEVECQVSSLRSDVPYLPPTREASFDWTPKEPGTYIFQVQAIDRDLNYSEPASVELRVIPDPRNHRIIQLEEHIRQQELAEMERIHRELEDARRIQQSLLPEQPPEVKGFEIADTSLPAREVSGDFYDYLPLGDNIGIVLADVTGKSVKAAMVAALADGMLSEETKRGRELWNSPGMILRELNVGLQTRLVRGMFTAMSLCIIHAGGKQLVFSNAGMPYPIVKRGSEVRELEVNGIPLGLMENAEYEDLSADLEGGDFVVLYSDGVIEAENDAGEMYQTERVLELIQNADPGLSAQEMLDLVVKDVTEFAGDVEVSDDITIVALRCEE